MDVLDKHFQETLHIAKAKSAMVQLSGYIGYFVMAMPAGWLIRRFGYKGCILCGLAIICAGALWFIPATRLGTFPAFLTGLFIIFAGLTCLETAANPYATVLGPEATGAARINLAQSLNSVGWIFGPLVGNQFLFTVAAKTSGNNQLWIPYAGVAAVVAVLGLIFLVTKLPEVKAADHYHDETRHNVGLTRALWSHKHFIGAVAAQFLYVAAQTGIFSFFMNYMTQDTPLLSPQQAAALPAGWTETAKEGMIHLSNTGATFLLSLVAFVLFFLGRFFGGLLLRRIHAHRMLAVYGIINALLMAVIIGSFGWFSAASLMGSFFIMSIMFPTIFALGLHGLGAQTKRASSFIVMAIVGGAIVPMAMGRVADLYSMTVGFIVPLICFVGIALYGLTWSRLSGSQGITGISTTGH